MTKESRTPTLDYIQLPQVKTLTLGNADTGTVSIPKYSGLLPEEKAFIKSQGVKDTKDTAFDFAREIAAKLNMDEGEVYEKLTQKDSSFVASQLDACYKFSKILNDATFVRDAAYATALIIHRLNKPDWTIEHTVNPKCLHPDLMRQIADLAVQEETEQKGDVTEDRGEDG